MTLYIQILQNNLINEIYNKTMIKYYNILNY